MSIDVAQTGVPPLEVLLLQGVGVNLPATDFARELGSTLPSIAMPSMANTWNGSDCPDTSSSIESLYVRFPEAWVRRQISPPPANVIVGYSWPLMLNIHLPPMKFPPPSSPVESMPGQKPL